MRKLILSLLVISSMSAGITSARGADAGNKSSPSPRADDRETIKLSAEELRRLMSGEPVKSAEEQEKRDRLQRRASQVPRASGARHQAEEAGTDATNPASVPVLIPVFIIAALVVIGAGVYAAQKIVKRRAEKEGRERHDKDRGIFRLSLVPGRGMSTTFPMTAGQLYKVTLVGTYRYWGYSSWYKADAFWHGRDDKYDERYENLLVDDRPVVHPIFDEDRTLHSYNLLYTGTGRRMSLLLGPPSKHSLTKGALSVVVEAPSPADRARVAREERERLAREEEENRQREEQRKAEEESRNEGPRRAEEERRRWQAEHERAAREAERRQAEEHERAAEEARKQEEEVREAAAKKERLALRQQMRALKLRAHRERHYVDVQFQDNLCQYRRQKVLDQRTIWSSEYDAVMGSAELLAVLRAEAPEVITWLEARINLIIRCEKLAIAPPPAPPQRRRQTEEEVRARMAGYVKRAGRDKAAQRRALLDSVNEFNRSLDEYGLDEDDQQRLINEYVKELLDSLEQKTNGKRIE